MSQSLQSVAIEPSTEILLNLPPWDSSVHLPPPPPCREQPLDSRETNINSKGRCAVEEITSQNHWHTSSTDTFICFPPAGLSLQLTSTRGRERGRKTQHQCASDESSRERMRAKREQRASEHEREREYERNMRDGERERAPESLKPVITLGDAERDWGFFQFAGTKEILQQGKQ